MTELREQAALLALVANSEFEWYRMATVVEERGSALAVLNNDWTGFESFTTAQVDAVAARITEDELTRLEDLISEYSTKGIQLITVLDTAYPPNLRQVYNRPPFLFVAGELRPADVRAVAVVGTRQASRRGLETAADLASRLVEQEVTVVSGLAKGIDSAAHKATIDAGGRTLAVMGTGIDTIYPKENRDLARRILDSGGVVISQFWPSAPPTRGSFPMRNVVMSGIAIGTAVIEASSTSGAKMQARLALDHSKRLFLMRSLVLQEEWAKRYARRAGTTVVDSVDDIITVLALSMDPPQQLSLR